MVIGTRENPHNEQLKEFFTWRQTAVLDHQKVDLLNKIGNEIVLKGRFVGCVQLSEKPVQQEDGKFVLPEARRYPILL